MTTLHHLPGTIIAIEGLPGDAKISIGTITDRDVFTEHPALVWIRAATMGTSVKRLPDGNWQILGWSHVEMVARQVVEPIENGSYRNYVGIWGGFSTATASMRSLLRSVGCEAERVLILRKI